MSTMDTTPNTDQQGAPPADHELGDLIGRVDPGQLDGDVDRGGAGGEFLRSP